MSIDILPSPLDELKSTDLMHRELKTGETLFSQEAKAGGLFYLISGIIDLHRVSQSGHKITIHRARAEDTFAEASLFSDHYHCSATAGENTTVIECRRTAILQLFKSDLEFSNAMLSRFASQIQQSRRRVELLSIRSADERIIAAMQDGMLVEEVKPFAEMIGLAPETTYRALAKLSRNKVIRKTSRGLYCLESG